jgi:hypothetical protein
VYDIRFGWHVDSLTFEYTAMAMVSPTVLTRGRRSGSPSSQRNNRPHGFDDAKRLARNRRRIRARTRRRTVARTRGCDTQAHTRRGSPLRRTIRTMNSGVTATILLRSGVALVRESIFLSRLRDVLRAGGRPNYPDNLQPTEIPKDQPFEQQIRISRCTQSGSFGPSPAQDLSSS